MSRKRPGRGRRIDNTGRSTVEPKHVRIYRWMMQSPAWHDLAPGARCTMLELYDVYPGNEQAVYMSVRELARRLGVNKDTAARYLWECEAHGFVRCRQAGAFTWKTRHASKWVLTEYYYAGATPTKDFMYWRPGQVLTDRPCPGESAKKIKTRSGKPGQTVRTIRTAKTITGPRCPNDADRLSQTGPLDGPQNPDTNSLPGRGAQQREAAAPRKRASGGERGSDGELRPVSEIIKRLAPNGTAQ